TYGIGRRLGSVLIGAIAAFLVATSEAFLEFSLGPMTDVPCAAGWAVVWWGALGQSLRSAWAAAIAAAIVIVVRPDRVPLALPLGLWLLWSIWRNPGQRLRHFARAVIVIGGVCVGAVTVAIVYWHLYGSPARSGYGSASGNFALTYFLPNLAGY